MTKLNNFLLFIFILICIPSLIQSIVHCSADDEGGGFCPDNAKCCEILGADGVTIVGSGCIPNNKHLEGGGTCCYDTHDEQSQYSQKDPRILGTACGGKYKCDVKQVKLNEMEFFCSLHQMNEHGVEVVKIMPRYELVTASKEQLTMRGFPITIKESSTLADPSKYPPVIAYYSNWDFIDENAVVDSRVKLVIIVVHGSGRNADEYLYSAMALAQKQETIQPENILIIAPRFLVPNDNIDAIPVKIGSVIQMIKPMLWNEVYPIAHTWRYGANALSPWSQFSSYDVMDRLVEHFALNSGHGKRYRNLDRISVIGHSAGGQFVHRWSLTSNSPVFGDNDHGIIYNGDKRKKQNISRSRRLQRLGKHHVVINNKNLPVIKVVAANPRSYCYLDKRRFIHEEFKIPPQFMIEKCPTYNTWEWGLDDGGDLFTPYKDRAIEYFDGNRKHLALRYANRNVTYLVGSDDTEHLHGSCNDDDFQGKFRRERSKHYYKSLQHYFGREVHSRYVVDNVGHDHSLMFGSEKGIQAIFD